MAEICSMVIPFALGKDEIAYLVKGGNPFHVIFQHVGWNLLDEKDLYVYLVYL